MLRNTVIEKLEHIIGTDKRNTIINIEKGILNWTVKRTKAINDTPSWENRFFTSHYKHKALAIMNALSDENSKLISRIENSYIKSTDVADLSPNELNPSGKYAQTLEYLRRKDTGCVAKPKFDGLFRCNRCKSKNTSYYQMQTRCADEPMTTFITCHQCDKRWKC